MLGELERRAATYARVCRRHRAPCDDAGDMAVCPFGCELAEGQWDVVRLEDGHIAVAGGCGVKTIATRKFADDDGNVLIVSVQTGKRTPYAVRISYGEEGEKGRKTGKLAGAGDEATAMQKLDKICADAEAKGWHEVPLGSKVGLVEIPEPVVRGGGRRAS